MIISQYLSLSLVLFGLSRIKCADNLLPEPGEEVADAPFTDFVDNFKVMLMHFAEAHLKDVKLRKMSLEGMHVAKMAEIVCPAIDLASDVLSDDVLKKFGESMYRNRLLQSSAKVGFPSSDLVKRTLFPQASPDKFIVVPINWSGPKAHALQMIIEVRAHEVYDITITNTGMGAQYHYSFPDPQGLRPLITRVWTKFENVPYAQLQWFESALAALADHQFNESLFKNSSGSDEYLYTSIFQNLKPYRVDESTLSPGDDRLLRTQISGSCSYSSVMAGVLYISEHKHEFLHRKLLIGHFILKTFWERYDTDPVLLDVLMDFNSSIARTVLRRAMSGVAYQILEYLSVQPGPLPNLINLLGNARKAEEVEVDGPKVNVEELIKAVPSFDLIKDTLALCIEIHTFMETNQPDPKTVSVQPVSVKDAELIEIDTSTFESLAIDLTANDVKLSVKLEKASDHAFLKKPTNSGFNSATKIRSFKEFTDALNEIKTRSTNLSNVDSVLTDVYDLFKQSKSSEFNIWSTFGQFPASGLKDLTKLCNDISLNAFSEQIRKVSIEDLAALSQLTLLTWKAAERIDASLDSGQRLDLQSYAPPISSHHKVVLASKGDPNGNILSHSLDQNRPSGICESDETYLDYDAHAPDFCPATLTTENEIEAWNFYYESNADLKKLSTGGKTIFFDPSRTFPNPFQRHLYFPSFLRNNGTAGMLAILGKIGKSIPNLSSRAQKDYPKGENALEHLCWTERLDNFGMYSYFFDLIHVSTVYWAMPWLTPYGVPFSFSSNLSLFPHYAAPAQGFAMSPLEKPKRASTKRNMEKVLYTPRNPTVLDIIHFNDKRLKESSSSTFMDEFFSTLFAGEVLRSPASLTQYHTFLNFLSGSKSTVFFGFEKLTLAADRLLGLEEILAASSESIRNLLIKAILSSITKDISRLDSQLENISPLQKERLIERNLQASFVLVRFIARIFIRTSTTISATQTKAQTKALTKDLGDLYKLWVPFGGFKSIYTLNETLIAKIHTLMWVAVGVPVNMDSFNAAAGIVFAKGETLEGLQIFHYFIGKAFIDVDENDPKFDLAAKMSRGFRFEPNLKQKPVIQAAKYLRAELLPHFDANHEKYTWETNFDESHDIVYFSRTGLIPVAVEDEDEKVEGEGEGDLDEEVDAFGPKDPKKEAVEAPKEIVENPNYLWLRISNARIIVNDLPYLKTSAITRNPSFKAFFTAEELPYALQGSITPFGGKMAYTLLNFRGSGKNYVFLSDGFKAFAALVIYEGKQWGWAMNGSNTVKSAILPLQLKNFMESRVFKIFNKDENAEEVILLRDASENPVVRIKVPNAKDLPPVIKFDFIPDELELINPKTLKELPKPLVRFGKRSFISLYRKSMDKKSIIMFGPYRFGSNYTTPVIFEETEIDFGDGNGVQNCYRFLNDKSWVLDPDQTITSAYHLPETLVIRTVDGSKRAILVPRIKLGEKLKTNDDFNHPLIHVDFFLLSKGEILARNRTERLALAYKFIRAHDTESALNFLYPTTSIDQNSIFISDEIRMFEWILKLNIPNPEITALKMMVITHIVINMSNFPREYSSGSSLIKKGKLKDFISTLPFDYLMTVAELSDKYYIQRIFPELRHPPIFRAVFNMEKSRGSWGDNGPKPGFILSYYNMASRLAPIFDLWRAEAANRSEKEPINLDFSRVDLKEKKCSKRPRISDIVYMVSSSPDSRHLGLYKEMHLRSLDFPMDSENNFNGFDVELLLDCIASDNTLFSHLKTVFQKYKDNEVYDANDFSTFCNQIQTCFTTKNNLVANLLPIKPMVNGKKFTNLDETKSILDAGYIVKTFDDEEVIARVDFVGIPVIELAEGLIASIGGLVAGSSKKVEGFDQKYLNISPNLQKLSQSIKSFEELNPPDGSGLMTLDGALIAQMDGLKAELSGLQTASHTKFSELATKLSLLADANDANDNNLIKLRQRFHLKGTKTFENLYGCYYSMDLTCFAQKFPHLDNEALKEMRADTYLFYSLNVLHEFCSSLIDQLDTSVAERSVEYLQSLSSEIAKVARFNDLAHYPLILTFQYRSKRFFLREEQRNDVASLCTIDDATGNFKSVVLQRMMAAGKTAVLGTLATAQKARYSNEILSILVPPTSLFQSNSATMQFRTRQLFKSRGIVLHFDRLPSITGSTISQVQDVVDWTLNQINTALESRDYLIVNPESLQSFMNSYVELLNTYSRLIKDGKEKDDLESLLSKMAEIYAIFSKRSSIILDEIDMTMNPKKELNFPTQERESYNSIAVILTTDLIEWSLFSKATKRDGLDIFGNNQASLSHQAYKNIRERWINYIETALDDPNSVWYQKIIIVCEEDIGKEKIVEFLRQDLSDCDVAWINSIKEKHSLQVDALIIMKLQIDRFLREALRGTIKEHYGPAGSRRAAVKFAVPYVAANTPSVASLFADRWETLNKTLLMTAIIPPRSSDLAEILTWIKTQLNLESSIFGKVDETATWKNFSALKTGVNPLTLTEEEADSFKKFQKALRRKNRAAIRFRFSYLLDTVISKLEFPTEQITSNALNFTSMFSSVQGYSGTIDNINILPANVMTEAAKDTAINEKNNGGIIRKILLDSKDVKTSSKGSSKSYVQVQKLRDARSVGEIVDGLLSLGQGIKLHAIIDVGAFLKNFKNARVAEAILLQMPNIHCALYYEESSNMLHYVTQSNSTDANSKSFNHGRLTLSDAESIKKTTGYGLDDTFTFYDQRHITGSDIAQPPESYGLLTVGPRNLLRDILQGTLRMRKFMTTQKVKLTISEDCQKYFFDILEQKQAKLPKATDEAIIGSTVTTGQDKKAKRMRVADVIALAAMNEDEKQETENSSLTFAKIDAEIRRQALETMTRSILDNDFASVKSFFHKARNLFIRSLKENPLAWLAKKTFSPKVSVITAFVHQRLQSLGEDIPGLNAALDQLTRDCEKDSINESVLCFAPDELPEALDLNQAGVEVQTELSTLQLIELELDNQSAHQTEKITALNFPRFSLVDQANNVILLSKIIETCRGKKTDKSDISDLLDMAFFDQEESAKLYVGRDLIDLIDVGADTNPYNPVSNYVRDGTHVFIKQQNKNEYDVILISGDSAKVIFKSGLTVSYRWELYDLSANLIARNTSGKNFLESVNKPSLKKAFFNLLVFNGSLLQMSTGNWMRPLFLVWLKSEIHAMNRLNFVQLRMMKLQEKSRYMFDEDDHLLRRISQALNGDKEAFAMIQKGTWDPDDTNASKKAALAEQKKLRSGGSKIAATEKKEEEEEKDERFEIRAVNFYDKPSVMCKAAKLAIDDLTETGSTNTGDISESESSIDSEMVITDDDIEDAYAEEEDEEDDLDSVDDESLFGLDDEELSSCNSSTKKNKRSPMSRSRLAGAGFFSDVFGIKFQKKNYDQFAKGSGIDHSVEGSESEPESSDGEPGGTGGGSGVKESESKPEEPEKSESEEEIPFPAPSTSSTGKHDPKKSKKLKKSSPKKNRSVLSTTSSVLIVVMATGLMGAAGYFLANRRRRSQAIKTVQNTRFIEKGHDLK